MVVRIRMKSFGRRHRPFFRICVMDSRKPRDGRAIEEIGTYDPMVTEKAQRVKLDLERVDYWISVGAQPSDKVATLIKKVRLNKFGETSAPPPMTPPKERPAPEPEAEAAETPPAETSEATAESQGEDGGAAQTAVQESSE